ncbi:MAG: hypothetical protein QM775_08385 [Pirellulales bacterium]
MDVDGAEIAWNGSAAGGVADVDRCLTTYTRVTAHDNLGAAFYLSGNVHHVSASRIYNQCTPFSVDPKSKFEQIDVTIEK